MTIEYKALLEKYADRMEIYFGENKFHKHGSQKFLFWSHYIKYSLDTHYSNLAWDIFCVLKRRKVIVQENIPYYKKYYHKDYKPSKEPGKLDFH